jgi:hypothetical protein
VLSVNALFIKNANKAKYNIILEWVKKCAGKILIAMD